MEVNKALEEKLWSVSSKNYLDKETCDRIIDYLLARLSDYLKRPLELTSDTGCDGDALSADFRGKIASDDVFHISYVGTLGMQIIDEELGPHYSAWLFLFGSHHRLTAGQSNRSYIYLEYQRKENNFGQWHSYGWGIDEFDEYEDIIEDEHYYKAETNN